MSNQAPSLKQTIEAILYLKSQPLTLGTLAEQAGCGRDAAKAALLELMADYSERQSSLEVVETSAGYALQLRESFHGLVQKIIPAEVGLGALRTLATIVLRGPLSQAELVELRGSGVYQQVQELVEQGFVRKRRHSDSRSYWIQVTDKFHQYFQLSDLSLHLERLAQKQRPAQEELDLDAAEELDLAEVAEELEPDPVAEE
ncbi:SMC-Scp complex subunit ScpB [Leptolyngbya sp. FACHB-261]|uniref:SMC-Scp complex subunit ScpB n=1 Tax=Leptolyngbya sp. FACHB-261 TaxID=2692806 RepID=UPI001686D4D8|nr:SMC-Scp complex subunit ScpB [Leptolyngbya sp. FACHB-261]MBD2100150.1 SMC-Scp complex subunit ScpB [Leptolyngbya sp. FACHB-261]